MKLRTHYWLLAISVVLPVAIFSSIAVNMLLDAQRAAAMSRIAQSARSTALVIDGEIGRAQAVLHVLSRSHTLAVGDLRGFYADAQRANAGEGAWMILYDPNGQQLVNTRLPFGAPLPKRPDGAVVGELLRSGKGAVSNMKFGPALNSSLVAVEQPFRTAQGEGRVVTQAYSPSYFSRAIAGRMLPEGWRVSVIDRNGMLLARRDDAEQLVGRRAQPETLAAIHKANEGALRVTTRSGVDVYNYFVRSPLSGWTVVIGVPVQEVEQAVWRSGGVVLAGLLIAIVTALSLGVFTGRRLVRFVTRASKAARELGEGAPVSPLARSGIGELEALNEALREADTRLQSEMRSRSNAEDQRNDLLVLERAARAEAERQNTAKDEFLAMLGHELRNPLAAITSAVALLDHAEASAAIGRAGADKARAVLRRQSAHLRSLVDDLLEVNRALMGKLVLETQPVDLCAIVRQCVDTLQAGGRFQHHTLELDLGALESGAAPLLADPTRLAQVLDNILDNAIKYSPDGGTIRVALACRDGVAQLTVSDMGVGISADLLPRVFHVFVQGKQGLQRAQGGLGIGLTLVQRLVQLHGGAIAIDSAGAGKGTTVTVRLPLAATAVVRAGDGTGGAGAASAQFDAAGQGRVVLLVEDIQDAREMMTMLLQLHGCTVLAAADGPAALAHAASGQPEVALIDIGLPGMDGYAVARALQSAPATRGIRLVALTGYGSEDDRRRAHEAGFALHITKPLTPDALRTALAPTTAPPTVVSGTDMDISTVVSGTDISRKE